MSLNNFFAPRTKRASGSKDDGTATKKSRTRPSSLSSSSASSCGTIATAASTISTLSSTVAFSSIEQLPKSKEWRATDCGTLLYYYPPSSPDDSTKIAGFDIDGTIINTKSGKAFAKDQHDWCLWSIPHVKQVLSRLVSEGYRVVFFTNQEGISKGKVNKKEWTNKVGNVIDALGLKDQVTVLASVTNKENDYRKPHVGMWRFLGERLCSPASLPVAAESMYVGDAAGRPKRGTAKMDFSASDYKFALNVGGGLTFKTPEMAFFGSTKPSDRASTETSNMGFQPKQHWASYLDRPCDARDKDFDELVATCGMKKEVIVIVGSPASGKSSTTGRLIREVANSTEYVRVNQDTLKTLAKCVNTTAQALKDSKSAIIDNTNRDVKTRKEYIDVAKSFGVPCRCLWVTTTKEECFHLNAFRGAVGNADGERRTVPAMVIHSFYKNLVEPNVSEGFAEVRKLNFIPGPFDSEDCKARFYRFAM